MSFAKRLVSALCAFTVSGAYYAFALPKVDWLGIAEGVVSKIEGGSVDVKKPSPVKSKSGKSKKGKKIAGKGKKGKGKKKKESLRLIGWDDLIRLLKMLKSPYTTSVSMLKEHGVKWGGVALGGVALEKILEFPFNQVIYPICLELMDKGYKVLAAVCNLGGEQADNVFEIAKKVDSIGIGFGNFVKKLDNAKKENISKDLNDFPISYDNVVFICYILSLHYRGRKYKNKDVINRFCEAGKRFFIPFKSKRSNYRFDKNACVGSEEDMKDSNHFLKDGTRKNSWFEFGFLGYDEPVTKAFNTKAFENWIARALTLNDDVGVQTFKKRFDDFNDKGVAKEVVITPQGSNYWDVNCDGDKLYFVSKKATVGRTAGTLTAIFTIPSGGEKMKGNDLLDIQFKKD